MSCYQRLLTVVFIAAFALLAGCVAEDFSAQNNGDLDSGRADVSDAGRDATSDVVQDTTSDVARDATSDVARDATSDTDTASDATRDTADTQIPQCEADQECTGGDNQIGECDMASNTCSFRCQPNFGACDDDTTNGCETPTDTVDNCGVCGKECASDDDTHYARICSDGACDFSDSACAPGFVDVSQRVDDGCECEITDVNDVPDATGEDTNCDGVDGILDGADANVIFVDADTGISNGDGLSPQSPLKSLQAAIDKAASEQRAFVLAAGGTYKERIELKDGVSIYGGYDPDNGWGRDTNSKETTIEPELTAFASGTEHYKSVSAEGLIDAVTIDHVTIKSVNARSPSNPASPGGSSYGLWAKDAADLTVHGSKIIAGKGSTGNDGVRGEDGSTRLSNDTCMPSTFTGGGGGVADPSVQPCADSNRDGILENDGDPAPAGADGQGSTSTSGNGGFGGAHKCGTTTSSTGGAGAAGEDGTRGTSGAMGEFSSGAADSFDTDGHWLAAQATTPGSAATATNGGGGGGGGAGGNYETEGCIINTGTGGCVNKGGNGGHGGKGGCAGTAATNGQAGGGSFGIAMFGGQLTVTDTRIVMGTGGDGGKGGRGGRGDDSNLSDGKTSETNGAGEAGNGGPGGFGGPGGDGGSGAGGPGGPSIGIALADSAGLTSTATTYDASSSAGSGGEGGTTTNAGPAGRHATEFTF
jgi:hypothetical protein